MKRKLVSILFLSLILLSSLGIAFARDSRYYQASSWGSEIQYPSHVSGTWIDFYSIEGAWNPFENDIKYWNKFAEIIDCEAGFYHFWSRFIAEGQSMAEDDVYAYLKLFVEDESKGIGAQVRFDFVDVMDDMTFELQELNGDRVGDSYTVDFEDWAVQLEIKVTVRGNEYVDYNYQVTMWKIEIETGEYTELESFYHFGVSNIPDDALFYHRFYIKNGKVPHFREWSVLSSIEGIGISPDVAEEDCAVDMSDIGFVANLYGCYMNDGTGRYWNEGGFKADVVLDGFIDMTDLGWIASKYGQSW